MKNKIITILIISCYINNMRRISDLSTADTEEHSSYSPESWVEVDTGTAICDICLENINTTDLVPLPCGKEENEHLICAGCLDYYQHPTAATKNIRPQCGHCSQPIDLKKAMESLRYKQTKKLSRTLASKIKDCKDELKAIFCCQR